MMLSSNRSSMCRRSDRPQPRPRASRSMAVYVRNEISYVMVSDFLMSPRFPRNTSLSLSEHHLTTPLPIIKTEHSYHLTTSRRSSPMEFRGDSWVKSSADSRGRDSSSRHSSFIRRPKLWPRSTTRTSRPSPSIPSLSSTSSAVLSCQWSGRAREWLPLLASSLGPQTLSSQSRGLSGETLRSRWGEM